MNGVQTMASGIWGLILEPGKRYAKSVDIPFHITFAALDTSNRNGEDEIVSVMLEVDDMELIICNLSVKNGILQCPLNLKFDEGSRVAFYTTGTASSVHLSGNITGNKVGSLETGGKFKEKKRKGVTEDLLIPKKIKKTEESGAIAKKIEVVENENESSEDDEESDSEDSEEEEEEEDEEEVSDEDEEEEVDNIFKMKKNGEAAKPKAVNQTTSQTPNKSPKVVKQGGITCEDLVIGKGKEATRGKNVFVYYEGRLASNNRLFDKCLSGKPFKFRLGSREVIQGWDIGILGMKVGGKRRLVLPPHMAYGKRGAPPDIPPQAALKFVVELKSVA